jgi:acetyltransferase-like isoleucine patch superfamily enzyme
MKQVNLTSFKTCSFGSNVSIKSDIITICGGARIGDNVSIEAKEVFIGYDAVIEKGTEVRGLKQPMRTFKIGDNTLIGFNNQILVPHFEMLDYSQLHNSGLNSGYESLTIGYNCWIGQATILNATERLQIGNNVRIGTQSQLWTHVASGELLEGCTLYGARPLVLKDNVWIVGGAIISPGLVLGENTIIMTGAVLTKNTPPFSTFAGIPARNVTTKLCFWKKLSVDDKFAMINQFVSDFVEEYPQYRDYVYIRSEISNEERRRLGKDHLVIVKKAEEMRQMREYPCSVFDVSSKRYMKKRSQIEVDWIKFTIGYRVRFLPFENS